MADKGEGREMPGITFRFLLEQLGGPTYRYGIEKRILGMGERSANAFGHTKFESSKWTWPIGT